MFSVYGITGQVFSGTLEYMNRVRGMARARSSGPIDRGPLGRLSFPKMALIGTAAVIRPDLAAIKTQS